MSWFFLFAFISVTEISSQQSYHKIADSLYQVGDSLYYSSEYEKAITLYSHSLDYYLLTGDQEKISKTLNDIGLCYKKLGNFKEALKYYDQAYLKSLHNDDSLEAANQLVNIGNVHRQTGNYAQSINAYQNALTIALTNQRTKNAKPKTANNIFTTLGNLYHDLNKFDLALKYHLSALKGYLIQNDSAYIGMVYNNIGNTFLQKDQLDSAISYYMRALKFKRNGQSRAYTHHNLGVAFRLQGLFDSSYYYITKAYNLRKEVNVLRELAFTANEFALLHLGLDQPDSALYYLNIAEAYALDQDNRTILMDNQEIRSKYLRHTGRHDEAYTYLERWAAMRDSVFNEERLKVLELQSAFDLEQKEKERQQVEREKEIQEANARTNLVLSVVLGVFLFISGGFLVVFFRQRKSLRLLNGKLNQKNAHISALNRQNFHFTKNSLAELASMLSLQASRLQEGEVKNTLMAEKLRMETINLLYRQLFSQGETADGAVAVKPLLEAIISNTVDAIVPLEVPVKLELDIRPITLPQDKALNLGIIANEVCLNACKYAFRDSGGTFLVRLEETDGEVCLTLGDSGNGLPPEVNWKSTTSFGLQLIRLMAEDMGTELSVDSTSSGLFYYFRIANHH